METCSRCRGIRVHDPVETLFTIAWNTHRILYCCWKTRTPYDETKYLNALKRRQSSLLNNLAPNPQNA
jgi:hypothetical protein